MEGFTISFNIYANSADEAVKAQDAMKEFISLHAQQGTAVTATKIAEAVSKWKNSAFMRNQTTRFFNRNGNSE